MIVWSYRYHECRDSNVCSLCFFVWVLEQDVQAGPEVELDNTLTLLAFADKHCTRTHLQVL